jgi:hypothetical protein
MMPVGPSKAELAAQKLAMDQYQRQVEQQQSTFQEQLKNQITMANEEAAKLQAQYKADAEAAAALQQRTSTYDVSASQSAPVNAQQTTGTVQKEKPKTSLKISTAGLPAAAGAGLNIGV